MQSEIENAQRKLGDLHMMREQTQRSEQKILDAAEERLKVVQSKIDESKGHQIINNGDEYMKWIAERGTLMQVIATSHKHLRK